MPATLEPAQRKTESRVATSAAARGAAQSARSANGTIWAMLALLLALVLMLTTLMIGRMTGLSEVIAEQTEAIEALHARVAALESQRSGTVAASSAAQPSSRP